MSHFTLHVVGLPHTVCSKEYVPCAYTQKVLNFCKMMKSLGHTVFHYGGEGSNPECDEHISIITYEQRGKWWGENDWRKQLFKIDWDPSLEYWQAANSKAVEEINRRIQRQDFICLIGGNCQKPVADAFPNHMSVEFGIGYEGVFSNYRVFESYAHMHYVYGMLKQWAKNYDEVIPNYFDPADFPFSKEKDDYFLFVGRLIASKGPHIAAEMANALGARLLVAGQGVKSHSPGRIVGDDIEIVGPRIEYVGTVDVQRRGELMSRAKALILPTQYIGPFEGVTVEAMMCGTPVITTDWGVYNETVIDGVTGFRTRTLGEMVGAARAVQRLDPAAIRKHAVNRYSIDVVKYLYEDYFTRLYLLWGKGWHDLGYVGRLKREKGGFGGVPGVLPVEPSSLRTLNEVLDSGARPGRILLEYALLTNDQVEDLDSRLLGLGYEFAGFDEEGMEYRLPLDVEWRVGNRP